MKKIFFCFLIIIFYFLFTSPVQADYVLPYPSFMPGNKMYRISRIADQLKKYWYWGNLAQIKYHQGLTDKYLVESKTLFEYKQYLLATDALARSDKQVMEISQFIDKALQLGIDTEGLENGVAEEMLVHLSVLEIMKNQLPDEFIWRPEKAKSTDLQIGTILEASGVLRQQLYDEVISPHQ